MYIILGGTGHVGSAVSRNLLYHGEKVVVITSSPTKVTEWEQKGAQVEVTDVRDTDKLKTIFKKGRRLFLLNPPAPPDTDTVLEEKRNLNSILTALKGSGIEKVVAESTYGAQPGEGIGDLGVLYDMEQGLKQLNVPASIIRAAYYMSNWKSAVETATQEGKVYTFFPPDFKLPMVAPQDIGKVASKLLMEPVDKTGLQYVEGPEQYSSVDVAGAFGAALNKQVEAVQIPEENWISVMKEIGFSETAARSMAAMTEITLNEKFETGSAIRGSTTIHQYISDLVSEKSRSAPDHL